MFRERETLVESYARLNIAAAPLAKLIVLPQTKKLSKPTSKSTRRTKTGTRARKASTGKGPARTGIPRRNTGTHKKLEETTYVYECTRADCNYKIVRDEKAERGERRYDLKCPKCHHQEFRCLGPGDLPQEAHVAPLVELDFGAFKTIGLGAN